MALVRSLLPQTAEPCFDDSDIGFARPGVPTVPHHVPSSSLLVEGEGPTRDRPQPSPKRPNTVPEFLLLRHSNRLRHDKKIPGKLRHNTPSGVHFCQPRYLIIYLAATLFQ